MTKKAEEVEEGVLPAVASEEGPGEVSLPSSSGARIDLSRIGSEDELDTDNTTAQPGGTDGGDGSSSPSNPPPPSFSAGSSHRNVHEPFAEQEGEELGIERLQEGMLLLASAEELEKRFVAFTERCVSRLEAGKTACEGMNKLLRGLAAAEEAYAKACGKLSQTAVLAKGSLSTRANEDSAVFAACESMSLIPRTASREHETAAVQLLAAAGDAEQCAEAAATEVRALKSGAAEQRKHLEAARSVLARSLAALQASTSQGSAWAHPDAARRRTRYTGAYGWRDDPWLAESMAADAHLRLFRVQQAARAMFTTAARRVEELQRQRHATLTQVLAMGVGAYKRLLSGLSEGVTGVADVLEAAHLERGDGGGGEANNAAADGTEEALWGGNDEEHALEQRRTALLTSTHVLRHGRLVLEGKARDWREHEVVLTRGGYLLWAIPSAQEKSAQGMAPTEGVTLVRCKLVEEGPLSFTLVETDAAPGGGGGNGPGKLLAAAATAAKKKMGVGKRRHAFRAVTEEECTEWILRLREVIAAQAALLT